MTKRRTKSKRWKWIVYLFLFMFACIFSGSLIRSVKSPAQRNPTNTSDLEWSERSYGYAPHPDDFEGAIIPCYREILVLKHDDKGDHGWVQVTELGIDAWFFEGIGFDFPFAPCSQVVLLSIWTKNIVSCVVAVEKLDSGSFDDR